MKYKPPQPQSYSAETAALITKLKDRIKRLEEAGDAMEKYIHDQTNTRFIICAIRWREAKEDKL